MLRPPPSARVSCASKLTGKERGSSRNARLDPAGLIPLFVLRLTALSPRRDYVPGRYERSCHSRIRIDLKRLVNRRSLARVIDKTLAHMIDESLRHSRNSFALDARNCLKSA